MQPHAAPLSKSTKNAAAVRRAAVSVRFKAVFDIYIFHAIGFYYSNPIVFIKLSLLRQSSLTFTQSSR